MFPQYSLKLERTSELGSFSLAKVAQPPRRARRVSPRSCPERLGPLIGMGHVSAASVPMPSRLFLTQGKNTVCVRACVCVLCPVHSSIKLGDDESHPLRRSWGPQHPGRGWVGARAADASSPCADRAPIIANACYVLREGRIYSKGLLFLH